MDDELRKKLLTEWQNKKRETLTHPFLKEKIQWGMVPYVQARSEEHTSELQSPR